MTLILKIHKTENGVFLENPSYEYRAKLNELINKIEDKNNGYACISIDRPKRPRTTGEGSQNNLFWKLVQYIQNETGGSKEDIEIGLKERAVNERGYPVHINPITQKATPDSMTVIDTIDMGKLIDTALQECAELGIRLPPNLV